MRWPENEKGDLCTRRANACQRRTGEAKCLSGEVPGEREVAVETARGSGRGCVGGVLVNVMVVAARR